MDIKKPFREAENKMKEAGRELDGHDASDDVGNAGDDIRKDAGNFGDDIRRDMHNREADAAEPTPADRTEVPRDGAPD